MQPVTMKGGNGKRLAALAARIGGRVNTVADLDCVAGGGLDGVLRLLERFARHDPVDVYSERECHRPDGRHEQGGTHQ